MRLIFVLAAALVCQAQQMPPGVGVSTWVREDIFAGFLTGDMPQFEKGMQKLADLLSADPGSPEALAWQAGGKLLRAVRAHEAGDVPGFRQHFAGAQADFAKGAEEAAKRPDRLGALYAIQGGSYVVLADRLPASERKAGWSRVRDNYLALRATQQAYFDRLPLHFRGEVLAGLAQAAQRIGHLEELQQRLTELLDALPGTVYASRARKWQEKPEVAAGTSLACQTCHEAGRLEPTLKRMAEGKK